MNRVSMAGSARLARLARHEENNLQIKFLRHWGLRLNFPGAKLWREMLEDQSKCCKLIEESYQIRM